MSRSLAGLQPLWFELTADIVIPGNQKYDLFNMKLHVDSTALMGDSAIDTASDDIKTMHPQRPHPQMSKR